MKKMCKVKNRGASVVVYRVPELGIRRSFAPGETKEIDYEELEKLTYRPGGMAILTKFLQIQDSETINSFGMRVEPEYYMREQDVMKLIANGSLDAFLDALDFAPIGVIDLIKKYSISMPLVDISKRKALKEKLGFDVESALKHIEEEKDDGQNSILKQNGERRVKVEEPVTPGRRTVPKYNVVTPKTAEVNSAE